MKVVLYLLIISNLVFAQEFQKFLDKVNSKTTNTEKQSVVDSFYNITKNVHGIPFIEGTTVNFMHLSGSASNVQLAGDMNGWSSLISFIKLNGTNLWYLTQTYPLAARLDYKLVINGNNWILDPANPKRVLGGYGDNSELAMPGFIQPWEIKYNANIKHGSFSRKFYPSKFTGKSYQIDIYFPSGFDSNKTYPSVYIQDGTDYINLAYTQNIIDNLLDSNKIEPFITIFVKPTERNSEYAGDVRNAYTNFFVQELVPYIDSNYNTIINPASRLVLGTSYGGNISTLIACNNPNVFGLLGLHSAAYQTNNYEASTLLFMGAKKNLKIYSAWGSYENPVTGNWRSGKDGLIAMGYDFAWKEYDEGHSWGLWRHTLDEMFTFFFPAKPVSVESEIQNNLSFELFQNYPNPFNPNTTIDYFIPENTYVNLSVYDLLGNEIVTLVDDYKSSGKYSVNFNAEKLSSGIYLYVLKAGSLIKSKKLVLLK